MATRHLLRSALHLTLVAATAAPLVACERGDGGPIGVAGSTAAESASTEPASTEPASTEPASTEPASTEPATTEPAGAPDTSVGPAGTYEVVSVVGRTTDPARDRVISYQVYAPAGVPGPVPVILVSHGGEGNRNGHLSAPYLGTTFASGGFVAIHLAHDVSVDDRRQVDDRPADITFLLDELAAGRIDLPAGFPGTPDLDRVGHTGHSFGAYTSHAVAGADYGRPTTRDDRIDAIAPISPQGPDQFGAFLTAEANTWQTVTIPVFDLIGGDEVDSNAVDSIVRPGWRLVPFQHYPGTSDTYQVVIDGQRHSDMWRTGSPEVQTFVATEILDFMRVYAAGDTTVDVCTIGVGDLSITTLDRRPADGGDTALAACA